MAKAEVQQAFIYIMAVIVIGFIVVMGFKYINVLSQKQCEVELNNFKLNINSYIEEHSGMGAYFKEKLKAPCGYKQVCFVDARTIAEARINSITLTRAPNDLIKKSVERGVEQNIFLISQNVEPVGFNPGLALKEKYEVFCVDRSNGNFYLGFRGQGLVDGQLMTLIET